MSNFYILGIDQSTQGTKGVLINDAGQIVEKRYYSHEQIIHKKGWISHNPEEIFENVIKVCKEILEKSKIDSSKLLCLALTNQRETTIAWSKKDGKPLCNAIVWQCSRANEISKRYEYADNQIYDKTGLKLSPYYPASKMTWMLENVENVKKAYKNNDLAFGTMDSYLIYCLTHGKSYKTDASNASRTQLFNLHTLSWDVDLCHLFHIPLSSLPKVCDSNSIFGYTNLEGLLDREIPICGVLGDSHGALFGHCCFDVGSIKVTYGTGSSIMLNMGNDFIISNNGLSTSLAWKINGKPSYVLEGNINYTGAVISWLKDDLGIIHSINEIESLIQDANPNDTTYIIPAFSGLGAPHWKSDAQALICGMSRQTTKKEIVKAACESIVYQINDVLEAMRNETNLNIHTLCVDGGPTSNQYIMQFQSDISNVAIQIPNAQELSVLGVIYLAGLTLNKWNKRQINSFIEYRYLESTLNQEVRNKRINGWQNAINMVMKGN